MKKGFFVLFLVLSFSLYGYFLGSLFQRGFVDIHIKKSNNLVEQKSDIYDYLYKNKNGTYEIGLFCYAINSNAGEMQKSEIELEFNTTSNNVISYIIQETSKIKTLELSLQEIKLRNADIGHSILIDYNGHPSEYINYNYIIINRYLHKKKGFVMELVMFNDIELINDKQFNKDMKIFSF